MPKRRPRRYGPTAPPLGLLVEIAAANLARLSTEQSIPLLARYRAGDDSARDALVRGHRWMIYHVCEQPDNWRKEAWLGPLFIAMARGIERMANPKCRIAYAESDVESYIAKELVRAIKCYYREESGNILPKRSTNSDRKAKGQDIYPTLKRRRKIPNPNPRGALRYVDPFDDDETWRRAGYVQREPLERMIEVEENARNANEAACVMALAETPLEQSVLGMLAAGMSERDVAESLRIKRHQVRTIIAAIRLRSTST